MSLLVFGLEMHEILPQKVFFGILCSAIDKTREKYSKFENTLKILSIVQKTQNSVFSFLFMCSTTELVGSLEKIWKFAYFWTKTHKIPIVLGLPCPLVANSFSLVEICYFHSTKELTNKSN